MVIFGDLEILILAEIMGRNDRTGYLITCPLEAVTAFLYTARYFPW